MLKHNFPLNHNLTLIILTHLNNYGAGSMDCCDVNVILECIENNFVLEVN